MMEEFITITGSGNICNTDHFYAGALDKLEDVLSDYLQS